MHQGWHLQFSDTWHRHRLVDKKIDGQVVDKWTVTIVDINDRLEIRTSNFEVYKVTCTKLPFYSPKDVK